MSKYLLPLHDLWEHERVFSGSPPNQKDREVGGSAATNRARITQVALRSVCNASRRESRVGDKAKSEVNSWVHDPGRVAEMIQFDSDIYGRRARVSWDKNPCLSDC